MKAEKQLTALTGSLLALGISLGCVGCLQSAFRLPVENPGILLGCTAGITLAYAQALQWKRGSLVFACLLALTAGYLVREGTAAGQTLRLLYRLFSVYCRAYHREIPDFGRFAGEGAADFPLGIIGTLLALTVLRSVCLGKGVLLPVAAALIPFSACVVVTDTVPAEAPLLLLMAGLLLLILPSSVRRENRLQGVRLTAAAVIPVFLALTGLFLSVPRDSYVNQADILRETLLSAVDSFPRLAEKGLSAAISRMQETASRQVDLTKLGPRDPASYPVMDVTADTGGRIYLRGQDFDRYDGFGWTASENRKETFFLPSETRSRITIYTRSGKDLRYLPYYPGELTVLSGGFLENPGQAKTYTLSWTALPDDPPLAGQSREENPAGMEAYLALPDTTRQGAEAFLSGKLNSRDSHRETADAIAALVADCARYSLSPQVMPMGEADFALWFLQRGEQGYCVHFATAATVLLRAAGIPARYVTGYTAELTAGEVCTVTEGDAHAWAEYYEPRLNCWIPLEATPATAIPLRTESPTLPASVPAALPTQAAAPVETQGSVAPVFSPEATSVPRNPSPESREKGSAFLPVLLPAVPVLLFFRRQLRLSLRRRRRHRSDPNRQALLHWQETEILCRLLKESPEEELRHLAQKAKFSQHTATAEELQRFDRFNRDCIRRLKEKSWYFRLVHRYVYAVY